MNKNPKYNASGCLDMTAYKAINATDREARREAGIKPDPPKVYICSPFAGDTETNVANALKYCRFALSKGKFPIAPHCYLPRFMDDANPAERELALSFGTRLLYECREMWVFGKKVSDGMEKEILAAQWRHIRIRQFTEDCREVDR